MIVLDQISKIYSYFFQIQKNLYIKIAGVLCFTVGVILYILAVSSQRMVITTLNINFLQTQYDIYVGLLCVCSKYYSTYYCSEDSSLFSKSKIKSF